MKIGKITVVGALAVTGLLAAGCATERHARAHEPVVVTPSGEVVMPRPPPPANHEVVPAPPGNGYAWMAGHWTFQNQRWIWIPGHWDAPRGQAGWLVTR